MSLRNPGPLEDLRCAEHRRSCIVAPGTGEQREIGSQQRAKRGPDIGNAGSRSNDLLVKRARPGNVASAAQESGLARHGGEQGGRIGIGFVDGRDCPVERTRRFVMAALRFGDQRQFDLDFGAQEAGRDDPTVAHSLDSPRGAIEQRGGLHHAALLAICDAGEHLGLAIKYFCALGGGQSGIEPPQPLKPRVLAIDLVR